MRASACRPAGFFGLALLLPALVTALPCDSLQHQQQMLNSQILLLTAKGPIVPPECLTQMTAFNFPANILHVKQPHLARKAIYEILRGLLGIFSSDLVQTAWPTTVSESSRIFNALYAQSEHIKTCFAKEKTEPPCPDECRIKLGLLGRYFSSIRTFLQEKSHSNCTGIMLQLEVRTSLMHLDILTRKMNS